ncbi:MAG: mechanosensitive ion channel family protein [Gaiellales bacterium]
MILADSLAELLVRWTALDLAAATLLARVASIAVTATILLLGYHLLVRGVERWVTARAEESPLRVRARTMGSLLTNLARWALGFIVIVIVLRELGVDVQAILVSAGVVGLAVGLGAQSLIRDVITGFFLLFEGLLSVGDVIQAGSNTGTVEAIGLRVTRLRMDDGAVRVVPNGALTEFTNYNSGWARAVVEVPVAREVAVDRALTVLREVGEEWARATRAALDAPQAQGIMRWNDGNMILRLMVRVDPARRADAENELRRRIKEAFDRLHWAPIGAG